MFTFCAIAAPSRHSRGEPRSPSPANPSLLAASFPPRAPSAATPGRLVVAPDRLCPKNLWEGAPTPKRRDAITTAYGGERNRRRRRLPQMIIWAKPPGAVQMDCCDPSASLQVHRRQQLRHCVAKSVFRDKLPFATEFAPLFTAFLGSPDFDDVEELDLVITQSTDVGVLRPDLSIGNISTGTPEPATLVVWSAGAPCAGIWLRSRPKKGDQLAEWPSESGRRNGNRCAKRRDFSGRIDKASRVAAVR